MPQLTVNDLEKFQQQHPDYNLELVEGAIVIMSPSGLESEEVAIEIAAQLRNWVRPRRLGRVSGSSGGFRLPNPDGDVRAPDVSFVLAQRLPRPTDGYAELVPDLMFEVKSRTDSVTKLREKIQQFLNLGTRVGILVDPRTRTMEIYRSDRPTVTLTDDDILTLPELLPGWELPVVDIWAPEFD
ncbi:Uma2 family endonuclease [Roseofilum casamattae]|uniref:Uma2 family endonuclease n=1 Tax=Roseofilum casamattae BLCC-M143 TaxID=3022442 RepID=A0ABT7BWI5_9CYAN|nr:Uma2 family endonuclease [Roseofilum casamattae]MDJ1183440.1 Uma2 family endonuclease [Roseofilum casamattae BLCC-M143]